MQIRFQTPYQFVFVHENVKHLLLLWKKEYKKEIYLVHDEEGEIVLQYPGETYTELVLDQIEPIFFQPLQTEYGELPTILGATFWHHGRLFGMYYPQNTQYQDLYFFEIRESEIHEIEEEEYAGVVNTFCLDFPEYVNR